MKIKTKAIISLLVIIFFILITNTKVQAKSYYIDDMQIEATVQNNGDLQIEQTLKYAFNGEYNGIYITIPTKYKNQEAHSLHSLCTSLSVPKVPTRGQ